MCGGPPWESTFRIFYDNPEVYIDLKISDFETQEKETVLPFTISEIGLTPSFCEVSIPENANPSEIARAILEPVARFLGHPSFPQEL